MQVSWIRRYSNKEVDIDCSRILVVPAARVGRGLANREKGRRHLGWGRARLVRVDERKSRKARKRGEV